MKKKWPIKPAPHGPNNVIYIPDYGPNKHGFEKISPNCYRGLPVRGWDELLQLADDKKPVVIHHITAPYWNKITSAYWLLSRNGHQIREYFKYNSLYHCVTDEDF